MDRYTKHPNGSTSSRKSSASSNAGSSYVSGISTASEESSTPSVRLDAKTSTPQMPPCSCPQTVFYRRNQHIGVETRHAEFKRRGPIRDPAAFEDLVGRYVCGFLNSGGGALYLGVDDEGLVVGIRMGPMFKGRVKAQVLQAMEGINPPLAPEEYDINFARVMDEVSDRTLFDTFVVEICVHPRENSDTMYDYDGTHYVRRDASLQNAGFVDRPRANASSSATRNTS